MSAYLPSSLGPMLDEQKAIDQTFKDAGALRSLGDRPLVVLVDLSALDLIDSSGVAALVKLFKAVRSLGGTVTISGARDQPLAIFRLLKMDKVFNL